ncbi:unnamed protein product, partial [Tuber aestivum]
GPLQPEPGSIPAFAQLYFYDPQYAADLRQSTHPRLDSSVLLALTNELHQVNPYIHIYKTAKEQLDSIEDSGVEAQVVLNPQLRLVMETGADKRRENLPASNEIAAIIPNEYGEPGFRDIVLAKRLANSGSAFSTINPNHASYMALHYVLLFSQGDLGWHWSLEIQD